MTIGALIFAYNNESTDYIRMAAWTAENVRRHLNIPVAVVTNSFDSAKDYNFDRIITADGSQGGTRSFEDYEKTVTWYNGGRVDAYKLTPWDRTLVLDADYVVASDQLAPLLQASTDFMCHRLAHDVTGIQHFDDLNHFGQHLMPMWWATVMVFNKSTQAEIIFDSMAMVKQHWDHYRNLYKNTRSTYRNDHALSIALNIENGHTLTTTDIPWSLATVVPRHKLTQVDIDCYRVDFQTVERKPRYIILTSDFHAMGKAHLENIIANYS